MFPYVNKSYQLSCSPVNMQRCIFPGLFYGGKWVMGSGDTPSSLDVSYLKYHLNPQIGYFFLTP